MAEGQFDHGRVLVFGDTSSFQNSALPSTRRLIDNAFAYLVGPPPIDRLPPARTVYVDFSHLPQFSLAAVSADSATALGLAIARADAVAFQSDSLAEL